ncbi:MAG: hypothetical protein MUC96_27605 [Myxococcaceae bacterium]|nr:hypothetical protein [Myxococcaceae bacterium]
MHTTHKSLFSVAAALTMVLAGSGCIIGGNQGFSGNITVLWSFNGQNCVFVPQVTSVRVIIPGAVLENNGVYPCLVNNTAGITLLNFRGGPYTVTVEGLDVAGRVIYQGTQQFQVNGDVTVAVNLIPTTGATGGALISWVLPQNLRCNQIGDAATNRTATTAFISIDNGQPQQVACSQGNQAENPAAAVTIANLTGGVTHTVDIQIADQTGFVYLRAVNSLVVNPGGSVAATFQPQWVVGSLPIQWTFFNQGLQITCAQAFVDFVFVNFRNQQTQTWVFADAAGNPTAGQQVPCLSPNNLQGTFFPYLQVGNYEVSLQAPVRAGVGNYTYQSGRSGQIPVVQVQPGVFAQSEQMGQVVPLQ